MNFTNEELQMLAAASDIQETWKPAVGDYWMKQGPADDEIGEIMLIGNEFDRDETDFQIHKAIWLPRLDQLIEMIPIQSKWHTELGRLMDISDWLSSGPGVNIMPKAPLKLWILAYVMYLNHNKHWNGFEWVIS